MPLPSSRLATWRPAEPGDASAGGQPLLRGTGAGLHPGLGEWAGRPREVGWAAPWPALTARPKGLVSPGACVLGLAGRHPVSVLHASPDLLGALRGRAFWGLFSDLRLCKTQLARASDCTLGS